MYAVLNRANLVIALTSAVSFVKRDARGVATHTTEADASAIYATDNDSFYPLKASSEWAGDDYHAAEVPTPPAELAPGFWYFAEGEFFTTAEKRAERDALEAQKAAPAAASIAFVTLAEEGKIDPATVTENATQFAPWAYPVPYVVGNIRAHTERLYKCIQAHTSQETWAPQDTASLWTAIGDPAEEWPTWSQPIGAHDTYAEGAKVTHKGARWISTSPANVWEPGVYGWAPEGAPAALSAETPAPTSTNAEAPTTDAVKPTLTSRILTAIKGEK